MTQHPAIVDLVNAVKNAVSDTRGPATIFKLVAPKVKSLAKDQSWLKQEYFECDIEQGMGITVLNKEHDNSIFVETVAWLPGRGVLPRDHKTWGIVIGIDGTEVNVNWERIDDGKDKKFADIKISGERKIGNGDVVFFLPDDIHSVLN